MRNLYGPVSLRIICICFLCFMLLPIPGQTQSSTFSHIKPAWVREEPIVLGFQTCDMVMMLRRSGRLPREWYKEDYAHWKSEDQVREWKEQGVTLVVLNFYRGFGLEAEKQQIEDTIHQAEICRKYGLRVGVYVVDTIAYETFLLEKPEAEDWLVPDFRGAPVIYGGTECFRRRPYIGHPGYMKFMKEVIRIALEDVKADMIHFDNACNQVRSPNMFHPLAKQEFREFLKAKYTPEERIERWGFSDVTYVEPPMYLEVFAPPVYMIAPEPIDDPIYQEWMDFRCQRLSDYYAELAEYVYKLNPDCAMECNPHGVTGYVNKTFYEGVDWPRLLPNTDFFWSEHERPVGVTEDGILTSKIRSYKVARIMDNMLFAGGDRLALCEQLAFNQHCINGGGPLGHFLTDNFDIYRDTETIADAAILRSYASIGHSTKETRYSTILSEQTLIQKKIPFDIIFNNNLKDLSKYSVLILADQESLSDEQAALIREYVKQGGGLVATGNTSLFTEWRRQRRSFALADVFGISNPGQAKEEIRQTFGKGRVVYIPAVIPGVDESFLKPRWTEYWKFPIEYWTLPKNADALSEAINWASGNRLSLKVEASDFVITELLQQKKQNRIIVHLLNYDQSSGKPLENIPVTLRLPDSKTPQKAYLISPDESGQIPIEYTLEKDLVSFKVPQLKMYDLIIFEF